jgi:hypothetical protein
MNGLAEHHLWRRRAEEIRHDVAKNRVRRKLRANHQTRPYVVRNLSWDLARFLETETQRCTP